MEKTKLNTELNTNLKTKLKTNKSKPKSKKTYSNKLARLAALKEAKIKKALEAEKEKALEIEAEVEAEVEVKLHTLEIGAIVTKISNYKNIYSWNTFPPEFIAARLTSIIGSSYYFDVLLKDNTIINQNLYDAYKAATALLATKALKKDFLKAKHTLLCTPNVPIPRPGGFTNGSDPEIFVLDEKGVVLPAFTFLPSKEKAGKINPDYAESRASVFWDGFQAEATLYPNSCLAYFVDSMQLGLRKILKEARALDPKATLSYYPVVEVPYQMLESAEDRFVALGCAPSINAYEEVKAIDVADPRALNLRFAGCHMHFGHPYFINKDFNRMVKTLDKVYGIISVSLLDGLEDPRRREFYGRAGEYRLPPHGLEYRTPSSAVLAHPVITHLNFDLARAALCLAFNQVESAWEAPSEKKIQAIINELDVKAARKVIETNKTLLDNILLGLYGSFNAFKKARQAIHAGARSVLDIGTMEEAWALDSKWLSHSGERHVASFKNWK